MNSAKINLLAFALFAVVSVAPFALGDELGDMLVTGQVLGPDSKPFSGAKIYVSTYTEKDHTAPRVRATSGPDGRFRFSATRSEVIYNESVVAVAEGCGPDWIELDMLDKAGSLPPLHLVKDRDPITGRVLDLENAPVANATVHVVRVRKMPGEDLTPWIKDMRKDGKQGVFDVRRTRVLLNYDRIMKPVLGLLGVPHSIRTGADGRFRLGGFGRERVVELAIEGPGIEYRRVTALTRSDLPKDLPPFIYGARFEFRASPAKPIVGTVREKGSDKPVAGVQISCGLVSGSGSFIDVNPGGGESATSDAQGRYRLAGTPKSKQYTLGVGGGPYFASAKLVNDTPGLQAITADFELERGILVRGHVTDKATKRPVRATVYYLPRADNPHLKEYPEFSRVSVNMGPVEKDGSFAVAVVPGRGLICVRATDDRFVRAQFDRGTGETPILLQFATFHAIVPIDASEKDSKSLLCDIVLDTGRTLSGRVSGPDGAPMSGVFAAGLTAAPSVLHGSLPKPKLAGAAFSAIALDPRRPRTLVFWDEDKKLAKAVLVRGDESDPLSVRLEPLAAVNGLLLDAQGRPQAGVQVETRYSSRHAETLPGELAKGIPGISATAMPLPQATTGADGRFRVEGLIPGMRYDLFIQGGQKAPRLAEDFFVAGGQCKDLGELRSEPKAQK
jgi:hypothetical protein